MQGLNLGPIAPNLAWVLSQPSWGGSNLTFQDCRNPFLLGLSPEIDAPMKTAEVKWLRVNSQWIPQQRPIMSGVKIKYERCIEANRFMKYSCPYIMVMEPPPTAIRLFESRESSLIFSANRKQMIDPPKALNKEMTGRP